MSKSRSSKADGFASPASRAVSAAVARKQAQGVVDEDLAEQAKTDGMLARLCWVLSDPLNHLGAGWEEQHAKELEATRLVEPAKPSNLAERTVEADWLRQRHNLRDSRWSELRVALPERLPKSRIGARAVDWATRQYAEFSAGRLWIPLAAVIRKQATQMDWIAALDQPQVLERLRVLDRSEIQGAREAVLAVGGELLRLLLVGEWEAAQPSPSVEADARLTLSELRRELPELAYALGNLPQAIHEELARRSEAQGRADLAQACPKGRPRAVAKKRKGRRREGDPKRDRRVYDAWKSGSYKDYDEVGAALGLSHNEVAKVIDRVRKQEARAKGAN